MSYAAIFLSLLLLGGIGLLLLGGTYLVVKKLPSARGRALDEDGQPIDEARLIQEMHHGLIRLEQRVNNLESLLHERTSSQHDHATENL
jgi:hypothetical protein